MAWRSPNTPTSSRSAVCRSTRCALELTYGLERIAMALQGTRTVFDLKWDDMRTYGDVKLQDEMERSQYAFNHADVEELHELFDEYTRESANAPWSAAWCCPRHDYVLQASQRV